MRIGSVDVSLSAIGNSILQFDGSKEHLVLRNIRIPRAIVCALVGANLAVAGALMQALTRNPLASPGIFGINAGASAAVVILTLTLPGLSGLGLVFGAFAGAAFVALTVYTLAVSMRGGHTEVKMALAGVAIQALMMSVTQTLLIFNDQKTSSLLFWLAGSVSGKDWSSVMMLLPWSIGALTIAFTLGKSASIISLGEDVARGLGQRIKLLRGVTSIVIIVLAGISVSIAGPIGFVGLIVPHIVRYFVGSDYRFILPFSAIMGAVLLVLADDVSRLVVFPYEVPVGVVTALLGSPYFIYLARRKRKG